MRAPLATLLVVALLSAGCVGKDDGEAGALETAVDQITGPTEEELRATPGSIQGLVLTPAVAPISNARVTLLRENVSTTTDGAGFFRFAGLANGAYLVSAEADGYLPRTVQASATNGTVYELNLTLTPAPSNEPFVEPRELQGLLSCGLEVDGPDGRESAPCSSADPNHRDSFEVDLLPDSKSLILELVWDAEANPLATRLTLVVETVGYGASDLELGNVTGEAGYARIEVPTPLLEKYYPEGGRYRALVKLETSGGTPVGAAFQMGFTLYATAAYHAPVASGYSVVSG